MKKTVLFLLAALLLALLSVSAFAADDPSLVMFEDFESIDLGTTISTASQSIPFTKTDGTAYKIWMGDYTTPMEVVEDPDPENSNGRALKLTTSSIKQCLVTVTRGTQQADRYNLGLSKAGTYIISAKVYIPSDSSINGVRMTVIHPNSDTNGELLARTTGKGGWKEITATVDVGVTGKYSEIKGLKFWNNHYAGDGGNDSTSFFYLDDISVRYYVKTVVYSDDTKTTILSQTNNSIGEKLDFPQPSIFGEYTPEGTAVTGLNIAGREYSYRDSYTIEESDLTDGVLEVYPIYTDIAEIAPSNADYGNLIFFDNFETATLGTYDANTTQSDFPMAMYIAPDYASNIESSDFCWSYGDTNKLNIVYDETTDNTAIRMGGATTNQIIMRRPATYAFNEKGNFTNPLTAPGIYTIVMDFIIPEGQSFTSVAVRTFDNRCARDDGAGAERKSTNKYVSASGGGTITVTQQILIPYNDITGITRFDFLAQSASTDTYCYLDNVALYFKPIKYVKFEILPEIGIRTAAKTGLRFNGFISEDLHDKASEYGFIVAKSDDEKFTDTTNYTDLVFPKDFISAQQDNVTGAGTTASGVKFICGTSRCSDNNISRYAPETNDGVDGYRFSGVITNLGNKERMTSTLVTRTYVVINDVYYYSGAKTASLYDTAMALPSEEQENPYIKKIIDTCETE